MSINAAKTVYCEGHAGGPDSYMLNNLLPTGHGLDRPKIEPIGGKDGWGKFFENYVSDQDYIALQDRDFDAEPQFDDTGQPKLQQLKDRRYMTGRTCLESYVLNLDWLRQYVEENLSRTISIDHLHETLEATVTDHIPYHAVRWSFQKLRNYINCPGLGDIRVHFIRDDSIADAHQRIEQLHHHYDEAHQTILSNVTLEEFDRLYEDYEARFMRSDFFSSGRYAAWFDGKRLLKNWLGRLPATIPANDYLEWAVKNEDFDFSRFPDLYEFAQACR